MLTRRAVLRLAASFALVAALSLAVRWGGTPAGANDGVGHALRDSAALRAGNGGSEEGLDGFGSTPNRESFYSDSNTYSTTSTQWQRLDQVGFRNALAHRGGVTLTFSGTFSGGPADVRVNWHNRVLRPGVARLHRNKGRASDSFTFGRSGFSKGCYAYDVQWRSPSGQKVSVHGFSWLIRYTAADAGGVCE